LRILPGDPSAVDFDVFFPRSTFHHVGALFAQLRSEEKRHEPRQSVRALLVVGEARHRFSGNERGGFAGTNGVDEGSRPVTDRGDDFILRLKLAEQRLQRQARREVEHRSVTAGDEDRIVLQCVADFMQRMRLRQGGRGGLAGAVLTATRVDRSGSAARTGRDDIEAGIPQRGVRDGELFKP
jgi:hypothetical protein